MFGAKKRKRKIRTKDVLACDFKQCVYFPNWSWPPKPNRVWMEMIFVLHIVGWLWWTNEQTHYVWIPHVRSANLWMPKKIRSESIMSKNYVCVGYIWNLSIKCPSLKNRWAKTNPTRLHDLPAEWQTTKAKKYESKSPLYGLRSEHILFLKCERLADITSDSPHVLH